ncbi:MAG: hypothetical protein QM831_37640 [Kofleriaceae bacterium]
MTCPVCGKPVDPLRAPAVAVRDGKVVGYCSREHLAQAETQPIKVPAKQRAQSEPAFRIPEGDRKKARTPASGTPQTAASFDSGPVIEIIHEPASGVVTSAADARSRDSKPVMHAETSGAIQIADTGHLDDYVGQEKSRSKAWILVVLLVLAGGGAAAAYKLGYIGGAEPAKKVEPVVAPPPKPVEAPKPPPITREAAVAKAEEVLRGYAASTASPRVQRLAASALARTGDKAAIETLVKMIDTETSDLNKLEMQYAIARGGDKRGSEGLNAALAAPKRDVKLEAARRLALLGDKRAINTLAGLLDYEQFKLGAAEQLAFLAEPRGIKLLEGIRADEKATADDKARAAIALGYAGKTEIVPDLKKLLDDQRFNAFAAASLASLHDEAARPVLVKQLEVNALRVQAARALRQLDPKTDTLQLAAPLLAQRTDKDTDQVQAAETVLLLAGPADWSAHE